MLSGHRDVERVLAEEKTRDRQLTWDEMNQLPINGWQRAAKPVEFNVELPKTPPSLEALAEMMDEATGEAGDRSSTSIPLPAVQVMPSPLARKLEEYHVDETRVTRLGRQQVDRTQQDSEWPVAQLPVVTERFWGDVQAVPPFSGWRNFFPREIASVG